ncbi:hypothetical protein F441_10569 [Phytophthora nicotianae CJ01A1]|uniref:EF-hand domain-containing protein n=4 Tax=Phytophthora nicotianae TaxID=4792 RepID=V9F1N0_PHYNI|nr:hypothetical protein F443_10629 [Phytophthora nicotianae P1569]ETK84671.1 hypothetical protein L915_10389 [Phytophthora nicotianae]ETO73285.1 hypothetical protein F444_10727 [Phytophthora nicotianae P1976]ETP14498.1 hypothetical protein F441_10569 [Phytophthora nicotianae CJ01A1]ETL38106.1 hypothetical protein L916_10286 [Phytophthora nicotianae]
MKEEPHEEPNQVQVKQEPANRLGLKIDTQMLNTSKESWLSQYENAKANGTPTATLPARFALLSTTCVYEPGFTTSPRGKRRISQANAAPVESQPDEDEEDEGDEGGQEGEEEQGGGDNEPFMLSGDEDYILPLFTDSELSAMVESPSKLSNASTSSGAQSPLQGLDDAMPHDPVPNGSVADAGSLMNEQEIPDVINMFNSIFESSQTFLTAQQPVFDLTGTADSNGTIPDNINPAMFSGAPVLPFNLVNATAPNVPFDYFSPSGYAAAANQFMDSYGHQIQPFFLNPQGQVNANSQLAAAMAMANTAAMNTMLKMNASYGVPIAPMDRRTGSMPPPKVAAPIKPRLPIQRTVSASSTASSKVARMAITPDIADFKLVQIFHQFCDPTTKVLTLPRFQQLLQHHQVKEEASSSAIDPKNSTDANCCGSTPTSPNANVVVTPDAQTLFNALDINGVGVLDLERFMHSFQICNRCTEAKRRAHQALCASQGQTFTPTALEKQLMEDVAPVVVRVVPTRFEGHKVKSCEHYQWTWCEGFEKTGNEKCRGTNRHDKCPKYLANCTLWKHKLPPKSRKPKLVIDNVDSPTKKLKHFS